MTSRTSPVTRPSSTRRFAAFGTIDCLVNNAGISVKVRGDLLDVTPESFDRVLGVNLRGTFFLTQAVARRMLAETRGPDDPPRSIVTISSANVRTVGPNRAEYCISKTGLAMTNQLFAHRLAEHDIMCYEIRPGIIRTDMTAGAFDRYDGLIRDGLTPVRRWGEPADVGSTVAALAQRPVAVQHRRRVQRRRRPAHESAVGTGSRPAGAPVG